MQHDDLIWRNVDQNFCSFKVKTVKQNFCRNKYNLTGLCSRMACPLANSRYATIVEHDEKLYLYIKTVERAHTPRRMWEKIKLSSNYAAALAQIDKYLQYWPQYYIHKAKQRLTKMTQYFLRKRRLALGSKTRLVSVKKKIEKREAGREKKAMVAAKLEKAIEKELLERLRSGAYGDIYNFPQEQYEKVLDEEAEGEQLDDDPEELDGDEYEAEYDDNSGSESLEDVEDAAHTINEDDDAFDFDDSSDDDDDDERNSQDGTEDVGKYVRAKAKKRASSKKGGSGKKGQKGRQLRHGGIRVEFEYEQERPTARELAQ